jgi:hypothetical protein
VLAIQGTEKFFNFIADVVIPDPPFTNEGLQTWVKKQDKRDKTMGVVKRDLLESSLTLSFSMD